MTLVLTVAAADIIALRVLSAACCGRPSEVRAACEKSNRAHACTPGNRRARRPPPPPLPPRCPSPQSMPRTA